MHRTRFMMLLTLTALFALPATGFAGERSRSDDRSGDSSREGRSARRDGDSESRKDRRGSSSEQASARGRSSRSHGSSTHTRRSHRSSNSYDGRQAHRYGYGQVRTRVVVRQPTVITTRYTYPRRYIEPMYLSRDAFDQVLWDLERARFEDDRVAIITRVARIYTVNTRQVRTMVSHLRFSDNRMDALVDLYSRVRDRDNWYRVYDLLTFSNDRRQLRRRCGS